MANKKQVSSIILLISRVWGTISLVFLLYMVGAHIVGTLTSTNEEEGFNSISEMVSFFFFPISIMIGLGIAWKWEGIGGLIITVGIIGFHLIRPDLILDPMIDGLAAPGLLFIFYWFISRGLNKNKT